MQNKENTLKYAKNTIKQLVMIMIVKIRNKESKNIERTKLVLEHKKKSLKVLRIPEKSFERRDERHISWDRIAK